MHKFILLSLLTLSVFAVELNIKPSNFDLPVFGKKETVSYSSLKGKKVLINFWASWCTSCIQEMPELHHLKTTAAAKDYTFLAINAGDTKKKIKKFVKKHGFNYKVLMDKSRNVSKSWGVDSLPVTVVLDEKGSVVFKGIRPPKSLP